MEKLTLKFTYIAEIMLKTKNKVGDLAIFDFKHTTKQQESGWNGTLRKMDI